MCNTVNTPAAMLRFGACLLGRTNMLLVPIDEFAGACIVYFSVYFYTVCWFFAHKFPLTMRRFTRALPVTMQDILMLIVACFYPLLQVNYRIAA